MFVSSNVYLSDDEHFDIKILNFKYTKLMRLSNLMQNVI